MGIKDYILSRLFDKVSSFAILISVEVFAGMNTVRIKQQMEMWLGDLMISEGEVELQE
jgi:hypothetical protein